MLMGYEFRKVFSQRMKWLLLFILAVNALLYYLYLIPAMPEKEKQVLYGQLAEKTADREELQRELDAIEREFRQREEKVQKMLEAGETEIFWEPQEELRAEVLGTLRNQYQEVLNFYTFVEDIEARAGQLLDFPIFSRESSFSRRNILKTSRDFADLKEVRVYPIESAGLKKVQEFILTDFLVLVAACMLSFQTFGREGQSGMRKLLNTTLFGGMRLRAVQVGAVTLCVLGFSLLLYSCNLMLTELFVGLPDYGTEIHGAADFRNIPFPCTVGKYLVLSLLWKGGAACGATVLCQAVIYRMDGAKAAWAVLGAAAAVSFFSWFYLPADPAAKIFRYLNPVGLFDTGEILGNYQNLNFFSCPVQLLWAALVLLLLLVFLCAGSIIVCRSKPFVFTWNVKRNVFRKSGKKGIFFYKFYKNLGKQKVWMILILLIAYVLYTGIETAGEEEYLSKEEYCYEMLAKDLIGKNRDSLNVQLSLLEERSFSSTEEAATAEKIVTQGKRLLECSQEEAYFANERIWNNIFFDRNQDLKNLLLAVICLTFSISSLFQFEEKSRMKSLLHPTVNGAKIYWCKLGTAVIESLLYSALIWGGTYLGLLVKYREVEGFSWSADSLGMFQGTLPGLTIGNMLALYFVQRLLSGMLIGIFLFLLAQVFRMPATFIALSCLGFVLPTVLLLIAGMDYSNPLIQVLKGNAEPFLKYIYLFSSWSSVRQQYPVFVYPLLWTAAALLVWGGSVKWKGNGRSGSHFHFFPL